MSHNPEGDEQSAQHAELRTDPGSSYLITVQIEPRYESRLDVEALHKLALSVLQAEEAVAPLEVGIVVTTDDEVHALNRDYLGHDYKTDVISFGMEGGSDIAGEAFITPAERPRYLGDVVVSYERAAEQAPEYGHSTEVEVATLVVHGLLHLLGYDDLDEASRERMHARQDELVARSGIGGAQ